MKKVLYLLLIVFISSGCNEQSKTTIKVDMSYERDQGRFNPEDGDLISIMGSFNDWEPGVSQLKDPDGDWIFEVELQNVPDTLDFKFAMTSEVNLDLPNGGLEIIPNRRVAKTIIDNEEPVFVFNKNWSPLETKEITFTVSMNNQEVLGFFNPDEDQVVVTGSFLGWDSEGIQMDDKDGDGVYIKTVPIEIDPDQPHLFKYKMVKPEAFEGYIPNDGWEISDDRVVPRTKTPLQYFNNQQRIARFVIDTKWLEEQSEDGIKLSDMFQIRFFVGEDSYLSNPLEETDSGHYETSVSIPLQVDKLVWTIVENQTVALIEPKEEVVSHTGKKIIIQ
jgi:hypothetical protein